MLRWFSKSTESLQLELHTLLREHCVPREADARLQECLIVSLEQFATIRDEEQLELDISSQVRWSGPSCSHVGYRLRLVLAWKAARIAVEQDSELTALRHNLEVEAWVGAVRSETVGPCNSLTEGNCNESSIKPEMFTPRWLSAVKLQAQLRMVSCRWGFVRQMLALHVIQVAARTYLLRRRGFCGIRLDCVVALRMAAEDLHILSFPWTLSSTRSNTSSSMGIVSSAIKLLKKKGIASLRMQPCAPKSVAVSLHTNEMGFNVLTKTKITPDRKSVV